MLHPTSSPFVTEMQQCNASAMSQTRIKLGQRMCLDKPTSLTQRHLIMLTSCPSCRNGQVMTSYMRPDTQRWKYSQPITYIHTKQPHNNNNNNKLRGPNSDSLVYHSENTNTEFNGMFPVNKMKPVHTDTQLPGT